MPLRLFPGGSTKIVAVGLLLLDQLDLVAVWVFDEGDDRAAVLHRPRRTGDLGAGLFQRGAGAVDVGHPQRQMAETTAQFVGFGIPVVGGTARFLR